MSKCNCFECNPYGDPPEDFVSNKDKWLDDMAGYSILFPEAAKRLKAHVESQRKEMEDLRELCGELAVIVDRATSKPVSLGELPEIYRALAKAKKKGINK